MPNSSLVYIGLELVIACLSVAGNVLVCWSVCLNSNLQSITNFFVVSLAIADIAVGLLAIPFAIAIRYCFLLIQFGNETNFVLPASFTTRSVTMYCCFFLAGFVVINTLFESVMFSVLVSVQISTAACSSLASSLCSLRAPSLVCWLLLWTATSQSKTHSGERK